MLEGLLGLSPIGVVLYTLVLTHITIVAVTVFLHRHQAHRALTLHPVVSHFFRFWLWMTTGMITKEWVAVHRKHHAKCETPEDPHSPQVEGIRKILLEGAELYRKGADDGETLERYGKGTPDDWIERNLYSRFNYFGIAVMLLINLVLLGPIALSVWAVQMIWIPFWAAGVINGAGHYWGYRNFQSPDASTNISPWGILIGGEELHNNHHAYPASAKLSANAWEFDIGWMYIRLLEGLRLAEVRKVAPPPARVTGQAELTTEAVRAVVSNRLQVLAHYGREVMKRVHKEELRRAGGSERGVLKRARALMLREEALLDPESRRSLQSILEQSHALQTAYQFRQRLQDIWRQSAAMGPEKMALALQEWCRQAEATGIRALEDFARRLGGYRMAGDAA
jgi:stearoyl-CoA desaturase (delta-9 desaturase)